MKRAEHANRRRCAPCLAVALAAVALLGIGGCGDEPKRNVAPGESHDFKKADESVAAAAVSKPAPTPEELDAKAQREADQKLVKAGLAVVAGLDRAVGPESKVDLLEKAAKLAGSGPELIAAVQRAMSDTDPDVREAATTARIALGGSSAAATVITALGDKAPGVRAAAALGFMDAKMFPSLDPLMEAFAKEEHGTPQTKMLNVVEKRGTAETVPKVGARLKLLDPVPCGVAVRFLKEFPEQSKPFIGKLLGILETTKDDSLRIDIVRLVGNSGVHDGDVYVTFLGVMEAGSTDAREAAFRFMAKWADDDFGFKPDGDEPGRTKALGKFRDWVTEQAKKK